MKLDVLINKVKDEILFKTNPVSIFLYGSYNTTEYLPGVSDLEIGVFRKKKEDVPGEILREIARRYSTKKISLRIYGYDVSGLKRVKINSPFTKSVFIRHLILTSKTIWGKKVMENLPLPSISLIDVYREACFSTMRALSGLFFLRAENLAEATEMAYKACMFSTLSLEQMMGKFPVGFRNIVKLSKKLPLKPEERKLIKIAYGIRQRKTKLSKNQLSSFVFEVMTYCSQTVEERILEKLKRGNKISVR
mgnify:CR=1 FL=1